MNILRFATIMAYFTCEDGSTVGDVNHYSNPDVSIDGRATGTDTENCAQTIKDNMVRPQDIAVVPLVERPTIAIDLPLHTVALMRCYRR